MKILYDWLKEFSDVKLSPAELRDRLSLAGIAVEGLDDSPAGPLFDVELTINRPDCLGHYGVAREAAVLERGTLRAITAKLPEAADTAAAAAKVEIECPDLCGRYTARILRGVKVGPSPDWLRRRLEALGQGSINNIVDATNYVMLELGQPMHAFDLDRLADRRIVVRRSLGAEKMRTLDGLERVLPSGTCVIADGTRGLAVAGIMGGAESEISSLTRSVLLESAWFDPIAIRRTSKALGLRTEASLRFERGADMEMAEVASRRCASLIHELAGGEILDGVVDVYPGRRQPVKIRLSRKGLLRVLGADVPDSEIEAILGILGFAPRRADASQAAQSPLAIWECAKPSWRDDVTREVDLVEEVARHFGLDKFPPRLHTAKQPAARLPHAEEEDRLRERLIGLGYHEIVCIPLVNEEEDGLFRAPDTTPARVSNPLADDASLMRSTGLLTMVHTLAWNVNRGQRHVRLFEIGRRYAMKDSEPCETRIVTIGATGLARDKGIVETPREYSFADLKGDLDQLGELAGGISWRMSSLAWQNPARAGEILLPGNPRRKDASPLGWAAQLASRIAERFKLRQDVFLAEVSLDSFYTACREARMERRYKPISRFPAVERDFSFMLNDGTPFEAVRNVMLALGIAQLSSVEAVDLYRGKTIPPGKVSLLVRAIFQSQENTFTEAQVSEFSTRIVAALEQQLGASLRSA